jgi:hypothetical protein
MAGLGIMGIKQGWQATSTAERAAWITGTLALIGVLITAAVGVANLLIGNHSQGAQQSASGRSSVTPIATVTSQSSAAPLRFYNLSDGQHEGLVVKVTLTGTVPRGKYLWIFVRHLGVYYVQGKPTQQGSNIWYLPTVNLGSSSASDANSWYTIYAVLANLQANTAIQADFRSTARGNSGTPTIPGGSEAKLVTQVTVYRDAH